MARTITINDPGLSGFGSITMTQDTAEVLLEALAEVLGVRLSWEWDEAENEAECGSITVTAKEV